jgi:hypothetical protein
MVIETDDDGRDDNDGPHCRNCHIGANNCDVCHSDDQSVSGNMSASAAYSPYDPATYLTNQGFADPVGVYNNNRTNYSSQAYIRQSAVVGAVGSACLDGGFSFPHRTLGKDMLKDELFGVDFDGTPIAFGGTRGTNGGTAVDSSGTFSLDALAASADKYNGFVLWTGETRNATSYIPAVRNDSGALELTAVENLDSVCIDCHGDASYWNGDNAAFYVDVADSTLPDGTYGSGQKGGWELLLKGLP